MTIASWISSRRLAFAVEGISGQNLCGWIFRRDAPVTRVGLALETDGGPTSYHLADTYRADVHRSDIGSDGYCGFAVPIDAKRRFNFRLMAIDPRRVLTMRPKQEKRPGPACTEIGRLLFRLDDVDGRLSGWVSSLDEPSIRCRVRLLSRGQPVHEQSACLFRQDAPAGASDALHGFSIPLPRDHGTIELIDVASGRRLYDGR